MFFSACKETEQVNFGKEQYLFDDPKTYYAVFTNHPPAIDGILDDTVWKQAVWTENFQDIEGLYTNKVKPHYITKVKMLWDSNYLYIAAYIEEPHIWATLKKRDEIIYNDNDFEVFIDPLNIQSKYYEIEINAFNTVFDLYMGSPYRTNGPMITEWNCNNLLSAIKIDGTINNNSDIDKGWYVEMAIPFDEINFKITNNAFCRINFSRVEWDVDTINGKYQKKTDSKTGKTLRENNWVWSPQGVINMHCPETWGYLYFTKNNNTENTHIPDAEYLKRYLWLVFNRQFKYYKENKKYANTLKILDIKEKVKHNGKIYTLALKANDKGYLATLENKKQKLQISEKGIIISE
jgi:hypothetical protein